MTMTATSHSVFRALLVVSLTAALASPALAATKAKQSAEDHYQKGIKA